MAAREEAEGYAARMLSPLSAAVQSPDDERPQQLLEALAAAFESLPESMLKLAEQQGYQIYALRPGERFYDVSQAYRMDIEERFGQQDDDLWQAEDAAVAGITSPTEQMMFLRSTSAATIVHETGHIVDQSIGLGFYPNSSVDSILIDAFFQGEFTTDYSGVNFAERWAESFRLWADVSRSSDPPEAMNPRQWAERQAPATMTYLDNLELALNMAFEKDPLAFTPESTYDRNDVVTRTVFATVTGVGADEISDDDVFWARTMVQSQRQSILEQIQKLGVDDGDARTSSMTTPTIPDSLEVINPSRFPFVERLEDIASSATTRFDVIGQSQDGLRVFGLEGAALIDAPIDAFPERPEQGAHFVYDRERGIRATQSEVALEI